MRVGRDWKHIPNYCPSCKAAFATKSDGGQKQWVDKYHYRETSKDGRKSYLYKSDGWTSVCVEITDHHSHGKTDAYEVDRSIAAGIFGDMKGKHK
ncbi:MAG: hypothetical protein Q8Q15_03650 [bacterium]|nr:hypothetical protein [bacterium]